MSIYILTGTIYSQNLKNKESSWEIGSFKKSEIEQLPYDKYPFVPRTGIRVQLIINGNAYEASFHHLRAANCMDSWISSEYSRTGDKKAMKLKDILQMHKLDTNGMKVKVKFDGDRVYI